MRAAGFLLACLPGGSSQDDVGTADCFFKQEHLYTQQKKSPASEVQGFFIKYAFLAS